MLKTEHAAQASKPVTALAPPTTARPLTNSAAVQALQQNSCRRSSAKTSSARSSPTRGDEGMTPSGTDCSASCCKAVVGALAGGSAGVLPLPNRDIDKTARRYALMTFAHGVDGQFRHPIAVFAAPGCMAHTASASVGTASPDCDLSHQRGVPTGTATGAPRPDCCAVAYIV